MKRTIKIRHRRVWAFRLWWHLSHVALIIPPVGRMFLRVLPYTMIIEQSNDGGATWQRVEWGISMEVAR